MNRGEIVAAQVQDPEGHSSYFTFKQLRSGVDDAELKRILALRYEVYCLECGFISPGQFRDKLESDEFDAHSVHFAAHNHADEVVGSLRLVRPTFPLGFPFERHCTSLFGDVVMPRIGECGEVSRLVVRREYRRRTGDFLAGISDSTDRRYCTKARSADRRSSGPQILLGLYREIYQFSVQSGIRYLYAAMEKSLARTLARYEFIFTPIGLEAEYFGRVTPYMIDLRELEARVGAMNPALMDWLREDLPAWH